MNQIKVLVLFITYVLTFCNSQTYSQSIYRYPAQRRAGYSYTSPNRYSSNRGTTSATSSSGGSYYNKPKAYYSSASAYPAKTNYQSTSANRYAAHSSSNAVKDYSTTGGYARYPVQSSSTSNKGYSSDSYRTPQQGSSSSSYSSGSSVRDTSSHTTKEYLTNAYNSKDSTVQSNNKLSQDKRNDKYRPDKVDVENAKFAGVENQEANVDESGRHLTTKKLLRRRLAAAYHGGGNRCFPYGRDAGASGKSVTPPPKEQGRFLFDLNVYNVYPQTSVGIGNSGIGCGGGFGGGLGGGGLLGDSLGYGNGLLGDPIAPPLYPIAPGFNRFLSLWAPGILQNSLAATARPLADPFPPSAQDDLQSDPDVDPNYRPAPVPVRRPRPPNRIYYDSAGAPTVTPGQLVGGVSTTINGIIQQLTGNVQPVYQSYRRSASYG